VRDVLDEGGIGTLGRGDVVIGTGGTVRNLAKMDRRTRDYPITRIHGYVLTRTRLHRLATLLSERTARKRESVPGLSGDRGDSIAGGSLVIDTLLSAVGATEVMVSGQGVREGLAARTLGAEARDVALVRRSSLASLASRFSTWDADSAHRRTEVAGRLLEALDPRASGEVREALEQAAYLLDIGRAVDFFERHAHAADAVLATELFGFSHREIALVSAILRSAGAEESGRKLYTPLLVKEDGPSIVRAGVVLALADDIEERCPPGAPIQLGTHSRGVVLEVAVSTLAGWRPRAIERRVQEVFGRTLRVHPGAC
jgi:exopolyphosphatase / guanosine-5'-triphosphate,3'-diphosphate pyrophosphatase